jgi:hypothetical protein
VEYEQDKYIDFMDYVMNVPFICGDDRIVAISRKPICRWKDGVLHNETGKSVGFPDGWGIYNLNGVSVPEHVVMTAPEDMTETWLQEHFLQEQNVEVRREILRKVGAEIVCQRLGANPIDAKSNYTLLLVPLGNGDEAPYLKMLNPSIGIWHVEAVGRECRTVEDALAFRKDPELAKVPVSEDGEDWYQQGDVQIWPQGAKSVKPRPAVLT